MALKIPTPPNSELVCLAWIADVVNAYDIGEGTTLPGPDPATQVLSWGTAGFVQCLVVGGSVNGLTPLRQPTLSIDCYATNVNGGRPPWGRANAIAEMIVNACRVVNWADTQRPVTLPTTYGKVLVREASAHNEPQRRPNDPANYAHYGFEMQMSWLPL